MYTNIPHQFEIHDAKVVVRRNLSKDKKKKGEGGTIFYLNDPKKNHQHCWIQ